MVEVAEKQRVLSDRVRKLKEELLSATPQIDTERIQFMLDIYRQTAMQPNMPTIMRRAMLFNKLCSGKAIFIDGNPIAGTLTQYPYGAYPFPEEGCRWMKRENEFFLPRGKVSITPELRSWIDKAVDLWKDSNLFSLAQEVVLDNYRVDIRTFSQCGIWMEAVAGGASHLIVPDYAKILNKGLKGFIAEVDEAKAKLDVGEAGAIERLNFYRAAKLALSSMIVLAHRYASLAREMAKKEKDAARKQELEEIAEICQWVPENPARNFREAVQAFWFTMLGVWLEAPKALNSPPATLTRALYPYYKQDIEAGKITDEEAVELLQLLFLKINHLADVRPPHGHRFNQSRLGQQLSLGGLTPDGEDATTRLDWLVLEAQYQLRVPEPLVNLVYHEKLSEEFLLKCVDLIKTGIGQPAFHNARIGIERHLYHHNMPLEDARTFSIAGCVQSATAGCMDGYWYSRLNVAKAVEFALADGQDPLTGLQLGVKTGDPAKFKTYDDFYQAVVKQLEYLVPLTYNVSRTAWSLQRNFPTPYGSPLVGNCIEKGKDISDGGAKYSFGDGVCLVGAVDAGNSVAAIKKLVYEDKKITMSQLLTAIKANWDGYEDIRRICLAAPKYGNDDDYADSLVVDIYRICDRVHPRVDHLGRPVMPSAYSVASHTAFGEYTGALPNGKKARETLVDASVSAQGGTDRNGPTALAKSAAKAIDTVKYSSNHLNMKFHPTALKGKEGARKLLSMIKTYCDLGGYHIQFNCVSGDTLKDAQRQPEKYKELIVRVAGFSAYFITLDKDVQDDIIRRTELSF
jgi:formate C-acetyltransferase